MNSKLAIALALVGLLFAALCASAMGTKHDPELPIRLVSVTFSKNALERVFEQLGKFAEENAFALRIAKSGQNPADVLIQMWRDDIKIVGVNGTDTGAREITLQIGFFRNNEKYPTSAVPGLIEELRSFLQDYAGVTSVKEK